MGGKALPTFSAKRPTTPAVGPGSAAGLKRRDLGKDANQEAWVRVKCVPGTLTRLQLFAPLCRPVAPTSVHGSIFPARGDLQHRPRLGSLSHVIRNQSSIWGIPKSSVWWHNSSLCPRLLGKGQEAKLSPQFWPLATDGISSSGDSSPSPSLSWTRC